MDTLNQWWSWLVKRWQVEDVILTADNDYSWAIILVAITVFVGTLIPNVWNFLKYPPTTIHEMGHVVVAKLFGRSVSGIKLHDDSSGVTVSKGKPHGLGVLMTSLSGYPAPAALATTMTLLSVNGMAGAALSIYSLIIIFAFLLNRNVFGFISVLLTFLATVGINIWNDPYAVSWTVIILIIFYSLTGIRGAWGLIKVHTSHWNGGVPKDQRIAMKKNREGSDAHQAWRHTMFIIPVPIWLIFFIGINVALTILNLYLIVM